MKRNCTRGAGRSFIMFALTLCVFLAALSGLYGQSGDPHEAPLFDAPPFWRQALGASVIGSPAAQAESVVMICDSGNVKAYSWQGRPLWDYFARGRLTPFVSRSPEGSSYICRTNGNLIALNRAGRELWRINLGEAISSPVLTGWDGRLFVFTPGKINCYTASGFPLWSKTLEKKISLPPAMDNRGGFYTVMEDGELLRVDAFGGTVSERLDAVPIGAVSIRTGDAGLFSILFFYTHGDMELLNTADGSREKIKGFPNPVIPLASAGYLSGAALLLRDGNIAYLSMEERRILWTGKTHIEDAELRGSGFEARLLFDERGIYLMTKNGATGFSEDGRRLWIVKIRGAASVSSFSDEGVLYSGGSDWILYAYRPEERVKARKRVLYGPAPEGNYGTGGRQPEIWEDHYFRYNEDELEKSFVQIREAIRAGQIGENEKEYASRLIDIAGSRINMPRPAMGPTRGPVFTAQRHEAVRLLSYMGSRETVPFLVELFTRESEILIKAAAADALGRIGVDPEGIALEAFSNAVFPPSSLRDEHALTALAQASGAICRFSGPPLSDLGVRILTFLAGAGNQAAVRRQAEEELRSLRR